MTVVETTPEWLDILTAALGRGQPVSRVFGFDRGRPIDRHYIESFLASNAGRIAGRVLEIGDATYTRRYGGDRVTRSDVLHATAGNDGATIVGDMADPALLPAGSFDCVILTQTLHCLYDCRGALGNLRRALAPGGTLLATIPAITPISRYDMDRWGDYWRLTSRAAERLFGELFPGDRVEVRAYGNAASATAFLNGLAIEDVPQDVLEPLDADYEVLVSVRVTRAGARPGPAPKEAVPGVVLMYHRVADLPLDPQLLAVRPAHFAQHLEVIRRLGLPMNLGQLGQCLAEGRPTDGAVVVTFDDGYADNLHNAKPLLAAHDVPATVFVTTGAVDGDREFWWDDLERLLLTPGPLPHRLALRLDGIEVDFDLGEAAEYDAGQAAAHAGWSVLDPAYPTARHALYHLLQRKVHGMAAPDQRERWLAALAQWAGRDRQGRTSHRAMTGAEVAELGRGGGIEVGAHTITHSPLAALAPERQRHEIVESRRRLCQLTGQDVAVFAYPFGYTGSHDAVTHAILRDSGLHTAVTTDQRTLAGQIDPLRIPRIVVRDWPGEEFEQRLRRLLAGR